ncbi:MAG: hypothetical protein A2Y62_15880 [Candidatus Fischerbacteria bacterium RBG_13_37_8]|uniref:Lipoyl-binding domain-containing protein n=1 Tax=Candidatus Fischerbacteria bacterium RBG_13_37_8 TaxID=1817863 RepID=A0A1F5VST6_9BACT|nr:MAG: hypothetical protein A2Y62_15880 [Candidatus Fischerbacteria bacterium RBG_13_37_8]
MDLGIHYGEEKYTVTIKKVDNKYMVAFEGKEYIIDAVFLEDKLLSLIIDGKSYEASFEKLSEGYYDLYFFNDFFKLSVQDTRAIKKAVSKENSGIISNKIVAPMAGKILKLPVAKGTLVQEGDVLAVIEAMKMQNEIKAFSQHVISEVLVKEGDSVIPQQIILVFE